MWFSPYIGIQYTTFYILILEHDEQSTSVCHILLSSSPFSPPFGGGDLGFIRGDAQEAREGACGFPTADNKAEGGATELRDMPTGDSRDGP